MNYSCPLFHLLFLFFIQQASTHTFKVVLFYENNKSFINSFYWALPQNFLLDFKNLYVFLSILDSPFSTRNPLWLLAFCQREILVSLTRWWNLLFIDMDILPFTDTANFTVTLFEHPFLLMDKTSSYKRMGDWWDSHVTEHSQRPALSLQQDLLETIFWDKHNLKCICCTRTSWNSFYSVWIWLSKLSVTFSKKNLPHVPCFCQSTHRVDRTIVHLRPFHPSRQRLRHLVFLFCGNRVTFNQSREKFLPRFLQIMSGWSLLLRED